MDMFTFEVDSRLEAVRIAAPHVFIQAGCRQDLMASKKAPSARVFARWSAELTGYTLPDRCALSKRWRAEGIPVTGHVGYVPLRRTWTGVRAVGKTPEEAVAVFSQVKALENAGAWAVEMEIVPSEIAAFITRNTSLITEGMGCGSVCDTQYLFSCDVLGTNTGHMPRHAKKYADLAAEENRLQAIAGGSFQGVRGGCQIGSVPGANPRTASSQGNARRVPCSG